MNVDTATLMVRAAAIAVGRNPDTCRATVISGWWRVRRNKDNEELGAGNSIEIAIARCTLGNEWSKLPKFGKNKVAKMVNDFQIKRRREDDKTLAKKLVCNADAVHHGTEVPFSDVDTMDERHKECIIHAWETGRI